MYGVWFNWEFCRIFLGVIMCEPGNGVCFWAKGFFVTLVFPVSVGVENMSGFPDPAGGHDTET